MQPNGFPFLLDSQQLNTHIDELANHSADVLLIHVGNTKEYLTAHLPNACFCDYIELIGGHQPAIGELPKLEQLESTMSMLGIDKNTHVIAYDSNYGAQASRLIWTLEYLGHNHVSILDGGLQNWVAMGLPITQQPFYKKQKEFKAHVQEQRLADSQYILDHLNDPKVKIVDARTNEEYRGIKSNSMRKGHIPGAIHLNWQDNIDPFGFGRIKSRELVKEKIDSLGLTQDQEIIVYCQTHQRSSHLYMVLRTLGFEKVRGYAGSWGRWGNDLELPIEM